MKKLFIATILALLTACTAQHLYQGQQDFDQKNYPDAMEKLLPIAAGGNAKAEYAVGYMFYTGKGVAQDKAIGKNYIDQAASQGLPQAIEAQTVIQRQSELNPLNKKPLG